MSRDHSAACFPTTHWGRILQAGNPAAPEARTALEELCRDYWFPLYAFVRRKGYDSETACDRVQDTFAELLQRDDFRGLDPQRGRFRSFLVACCAHQLARHNDRERAVKRGGGRPLIPIDALAAESRLGGEPGHDLTPERLYERRWALTLLDRVLARLDAELVRSDRRALYERLRPSLLGQDDGPSYRTIADDLELTEGAVKMAAHRLRARYRELLREEIARTIADPAEIDAEIRDLLSAVGS
jgi:RNA polymerase sigma-70 factor (ECF subfamily)